MASWSSPERIVLVGCVATKQAGTHRASQLYTSPLWKKRRAYAQASNCAWLIVSAQHGFVDPSTMVASYNTQLKASTVGDWSCRHRRALRVLVSKSPVTLEVHGGVHYVDAVERAARYLNLFDGYHITVTAPLAGMMIGQQLSWYNAHTEGTCTTSA